jgi:hypothetical protein
MEGMGMLMGMGGAFVAPLFATLGLLPVIIYIVARWRTYRDNLPPDPQLGFKTAMHFFLVTGIQLLLIGSFMLVWGMFQKGDSGDQMRSAAGFILTGGIIFGAHFVGLQRTNDAQFPMVGRMFAGLNLVQTGLFGTIGLALALQALFMKGDSGDFGRMAWSMTLVYGIAWGVLGMRMFQRTFGGAPPPGVQQFAAPPPAAPPPGSPRPY